MKIYQIFIAEFKKIYPHHLFSLTILFIPFISGACRFALSPTPTPSPPTPPHFIISPTSVDSGLNQLDSYRANLILDFAGSLETEPVKGHVEARTEVTHQPPARHRYLNVTGTGPPSKIVSGVSEFYQIDPELYLRRADEAQWSQFSVENSTPEQLDLLEPERLIVLPALVSTPPQSETLYGLPVEHYRFSQADLTSSNLVFKEAHGELWVATPGNYLVQYTLTATLTMPLLDPKAHLFEKGSLILHYTLADINSEIIINPPTEIISSGSQPLRDLPRPPDAHILSVFPTLLEYTTTISPISATLFYRSHLPKLAWHEDKITVFNEKANLSFSKEERTLTIIIAPLDEDRIKVLLNFRPR